MFCSFCIADKIQKQLLSIFPQDLVEEVTLEKQRCRLLRSSNQKCSTKKVVFTNFTIFIGKHLCQSLLLIKLLAWLLHSCFSMNIKTFLATTIFKNVCQRLLLTRPGRKLGNLGNLGNSRNFSPRFLKFLILAENSDRNSKTEIKSKTQKKKNGITFARFPKFPTFPLATFSKFSICHFFISFLNFFPFFVNLFFKFFYVHLQLQFYTLLYKNSSTISLTKLDFLCLCFDPSINAFTMQSIKCICNMKRWQNCEFLQIFLTKEGSNKYIKLLCKKKLL